MICCWLLVQRAPIALSRAAVKAGSNMLASMAIIAITTSSSMSVKYRLLESLFILSVLDMLHLLLICVNAFFE